MTLSDIMMAAKSEAERESILNAYTLGLNDGAERCIGLIIDSIFENTGEINEDLLRYRANENPAENIDKLPFE